ncbi:Myb family Dna-binding domain-containing protein, partial [Cardiosporidium cionae]
DMLGVSPALLKTTAQLNENIKAELKSKKPTGLNREVYSLCGNGLPSQTVGVHGPFTKHKVLQPPVSRWKMTPFVNPARNDNLMLHHWCRESDAFQDYPFAMYNFSIKIPKYSQSLYERELKNLDSSWTKAETEYLWELCEKFDLRFHVIHDRYDPAFNRSIEELKHRYYVIAKRIMEYQFEDRIYESVKQGVPIGANAIATIKDEKNRQPLVKFSYSIEKDRERKMGLEKQYHVTDTMRRREADIIENIKLLESNLKKNSKKKEEAKKLKKKFELQDELLIPIPSMVSWTKPCGTVASAQLEHFRAQIPKQYNEQIDSFLRSLSVKMPLVYSESVVSAYWALRVDVAIMLNLKKKIGRMHQEKEYWDSQLLMRRRQAPVSHPKGAPLNLMYTEQPNFDGDARQFPSPVISSSSNPRPAAKRKTQKTSSSTGEDLNATPQLHQGLSFVNSKSVRPPVAVALSMEDAVDRNFSKKQKRGKLLHESAAGSGLM